MKKMLDLPAIQVFDEYFSVVKSLPLLLVQHQKSNQDNANR